jgi:hypothetical protein
MRKITPEVKKKIVKAFADFHTEALKILIENKLLSVEERWEWTHRLNRAYEEIDSILDEEITKC